jgi:acyl-CoA dehydrogenase
VRYRERVIAALLRRLLADEPTPSVTATLDAWWSRHRLAPALEGPPIESAILGGFTADRVGFAFAAGYHAALRVLVPTLPRDHLVGLCATEAGGVHPRAIETRLDGGRLRGTKSFATLAPFADELLIVASTGVSDDGKNRLRLVRIAREQPGVDVRPLLETPFTPEVPHAEVVLDVAVRDDDVLPGDGWDDYLKPFRTIEDLHVHGAMLGHLVALARRAKMERALIEELTTLVVATHGLATSDPRDPAVHVAVGGTIAATARALGTFASALAGSELGADIKERFERDRRLLGVASKPRALRLESAWRALA